MTTTKTIASRFELTDNGNGTTLVDHEAYGLELEFESIKEAADYIAEVLAEEVCEADLNDELEAEQAAWEAENLVGPDWEEEAGE